MLGQVFRKDASPPNAIPAPASSAPGRSWFGGGNNDDAENQRLPWLLLGGVIFYIALAIIFQHEKLKSVFQPKNIGFNLHNIAAITLSVAIGVPILKVLVAKYAAWHLPWGSALAKYVGAI